MGTAGYMAPEVKRGEDATAASDAYSLGIVFFRLLTGVWFENRPNIWGLLEPFDGRWRQLLSRLLAENSNDRPILLEPFSRLLSSAGTDTSPVAVSAASTVVREEPPRKRRLLWIAATAAALLVVAAVVVLFLRKPKQTAVHEDVSTENLFALPAAMEGK
jgi:serine/threonine protein kinase